MSHFQMFTVFHYETMNSSIIIVAVAVKFNYTYPVLMTKSLQNSLIFEKNSTE